MTDKILVALGSPDDVPDYFLERIHKWAFMWLHEHGFEGEAGKGEVDGQECYFISIDKPVKWKTTQIEKLLSSFGDSLSEYLSENLE